MDIGAATDPGSFAFLIAVWVVMMAAMMLSGAVPAVSRFIRANGRALAAPRFAGPYLAAWTLVGVAGYAVYQQHGSGAAGGAADRGRRLRTQAARALGDRSP